jgi:imidazole glycerol phosphate synthase subunit HisF
LSADTLERTKGEIFIAHYRTGGISSAKQIRRKVTLEMGAERLPAATSAQLVKEHEIGRLSSHTGIHQVFLDETETMLL